MDYNTIANWATANLTTIILCALIVVMILLFFFKGRPKTPVETAKYPVTPLSPGNAEFVSTGPHLSSITEVLARERECILREIETNRQHYAQAKQNIAEITIEAQQLEFHIKDLLARLDRYNMQLGVRQ
jgi:hypothetical protein